MKSLKVNIFEYLDYRTYLKECIKTQSRGFQSQLATAMKCQATYLIRVLKEEAQITDDQAFRACRFLNLTQKELDHFLELVRFDRASDPELKKHYQRNIDISVKANNEIKNRVPGSAIETNLKTQVEYYSSWQPSVLQLATSCPHLQTETELAQRFSLDITQVRSILEFLHESGLVALKDGRYEHTGKSIHLPKQHPLHKPFQRLRREMVFRSLDKPVEDNLHFSSGFATSKKHVKKLREEFLNLIEATHRDLAETASEEIFILVVDLFKTV